MAKITQHRANEIVEEYRQAETVALLNLSSENVYIPSRVTDILQLTLRDWAKRPEPSYIQAVKFVLEKNKGEPFLKSFRELHAIFWLLEQDQPYEVAKKKARLFLAELESPKTGETHRLFWSWVVPSQKKLLN